MSEVPMMSGSAAEDVIAQRRCDSLYPLIASEFDQHKIEEFCACVLGRQPRRIGNRWPNRLVGSASGGSRTTRSGRLGRSKGINIQTSGHDPDRAVL